jgi:hypothetical protein
MPEYPQLTVSPAANSLSVQMVAGRIAAAAACVRHTTEQLVDPHHCRRLIKRDLEWYEIYDIGFRNLPRPIIKSAAVAAICCRDTLKVLMSCVHVKV